ncbi:hypothetical protein B566_EDAN007016 [Ephemera danica]|nr:hypothetical protein B566_EDAN007016 [Ephemera danica]
MKLSVFVPLLIVAVSNVEAIKEFANKKCPHAMGKYPFDLHKFAGKWYIVSGLPGESEDSSEEKCITSDIPPPTGDDTVSMFGQISYVKKNKTVHEDIYWSPIKHWPSISYLTMKGDDGTGEEIYKETVIATDYDNYAVVLMCRSIFDSHTKQFGRSLYANIFSRTATLDAKIVDTLKGVISGYDIDTTKFVDEDNSNCNF